jgi:hypothetical protein
MKIYQAIQSTVWEEFRLQHPSFPKLGHQALLLFGRAHLYYRSFKWIRWSSQSPPGSAQIHPAIYGAAIQTLADTTNIGNYALNIALIAKCAADLLDDYYRLGQSYQRLRETIRHQYPVYSLVLKSPSTSLQPGVVIPAWLIVQQIRLMQMWRQVCKIMQCVLDVCWQAFQLSVHLQDSYLLFQGDAQTRYEACTEIAADWDRYKNQLGDSQTRLIEEIQKRSHLIDSILSRLGQPTQSAEMIRTLQQRVQTFTNDSRTLITDLTGAATTALRTIYIPGNITSMSLHFTTLSAQNPTLSTQRFPDYGGSS